MSYSGKHRDNRPQDSTSTWLTVQDLDKYIKSGKPYDGQIVSVTANKTAYIISGSKGNFYKIPIGSISFTGSNSTPYFKVSGGTGSGSIQANGSDTLSMIGSVDDLIESIYDTSAKRLTIKHKQSTYTGQSSDAAYLISGITLDAYGHPTAVDRQQIVDGNLTTVSADGSTIAIDHNIKTVTVTDNSTKTDRFISSISFDAYGHPDEILTELLTDSILTVNDGTSDGTVTLDSEKLIIASDPLAPLTTTLSGTTDKTITISHDTYNQPTDSQLSTGVGRFVTGVTTDGYGHVISFSSNTVDFSDHDHVVDDITDFPTNVSHFANDAQYLTSFTETDPIFTASAAAGIAAGDITNWNAAYTYSQVGHLPLTGGTVSGTVIFTSSATFQSDVILGTDTKGKLNINFASNTDMSDYRFYIAPRLANDSNWEWAREFGFDRANNHWYAETAFAIAGLELTDSDNRSGILEVHRLGTTSYGGFGLDFSGQHWQLMGNSTIFGLYDDSSNKWAFYASKGGGINLRHNNNIRITTTDDGATIAGVLTATGGNSTEWNTAYNDNVTAAAFSSNVLTFTTRSGGTFSATGTFDETDPIFTASAAAGIVADDITNWDAAYGWGDHSLVGYLTSFTETDPIFTASAAYGIVAGDITNWNAAYGWGDHSLVGYLTSNEEITLTGDVSGSGTTSIAVTIANDSHTHHFNNLTNKTSGTGEYSTSGYLVAGRGSGGVALTVNDGKGNANIAFNHKAGVPEQNGNAGRIEVNTDRSNLAEVYMHFEVGNDVTKDVNTGLTGVMGIYEDRVNVRTRMQIGAGGITATSQGYNLHVTGDGYFSTSIVTGSHQGSQEWEQGYNHSLITSGNPHNVTIGEISDFPTNVSHFANDAQYLTSFTETDPIFTASAAAGIAAGDITNWNAAYGWGDHSGLYLTSFTETDPIFTASAAAGIVADDITNWDAAYTYSQVGHLPLSGGTLTGDLVITDNKVLTFSGTAGGNGGGLGYTDDGGTNRYALLFAGSNVVALTNRASNGTVQIRAVNSTGGSTGESTVAEFKENLIDIKRDLYVGDGTTDTRIIIKKADNDVADHLIFYNGTTRVGEIGAHDNTWLRLNQVTNKNIYTRRYIRADAGFFVDGTAKGINGSGNFIGGTITGASDAEVDNWNEAHSWGDHDGLYLPLTGGTVTGNTTFSANLTATGDVFVEEYIYHRDDLDTFIRYQADTITSQAGGYSVITTSTGVGINTLTPNSSYDLEVNGEVKLWNELYIDQSGWDSYIRLRPLPNSASTPMLELIMDNGGGSGILLDMDDDDLHRNPGSNNDYAFKIRTNDDQNLNRTDSDTVFWVGTQGHTYIKRGSTFLESNGDPSLSVGGSSNSTNPSAYFQGWVGIGTAAPDMALDVVGSAIINSPSSEALTLQSPSATGSVFLRFRDSSSVSKGFIGFGGASVDTIFIRNQTPDGGVLIGTGDGDGIVMDYDLTSTIYGVSTVFTTGSNSTKSVNIQYNSTTGVQIQANASGGVLSMYDSSSNRNNLLRGYGNNEFNLISGLFGIGMTPSTHKLQVDGDTLIYGNTNGQRVLEVKNVNTGADSQAVLYMNGQGNNFRIINWGDNTSNTDETHLVSSANNSVIKLISDSGQQFWDGSEENMRIANTGILYVRSNIIGYATTITSDETLKHMMSPYDHQFTKEVQGQMFDDMIGVKWTWKDKERGGHNVFSGVGAQTLRKYMPWLVTEIDSPFSGNKELTVNTDGLFMPVLNEIGFVRGRLTELETNEQRQDREIEELRRENEELKQRIDELS